MTLRTLLSYGLVVGVFTTLLLITVHQSNLSHGGSWGRNDRVQANLPANDNHRYDEEEPSATAGQVKESAPASCVPHKKFVFIKTHKTGSSTTINIFQRFAIFNKLKVLMPVGQGPVSWPFPPEENEYVHMPGEKYDALIHHLVYNKTWLLSKFPPETKYISIIRQPFSHLKSQMNYFHLGRVMGLKGQGNPVKVFLQDPWQHRNRSQTFFPHVNITWDGTRNPMTFDMGWPAERADDEGPNFYDELKHFRRIKDDVSIFCDGTKKGRNKDKQAMVVPASKWNPEFEVDKEYCHYITRTRTFMLDKKIRGRRYTQKELKYSVIDQIINYRLLARGLPTFKNRHDAKAAGIRRLRTKPKRVEIAHE